VPHWFVRPQLGRGSKRQGPHLRRSRRDVWEAVKVNHDPWQKREHNDESFAFKAWTDEGTKRFSPICPHPQT
jgi:hypothetical protein